MGNKEKYFEFRVQLTGEEGKTLSGQLRHHRRQL